MIASAEDYEAGFMHGYKQVPVGLLSDVKEKLFKALGVNSRTALWNYRVGKRKCTAAQAVRVEAVFAEYNITVVWGNEP